MEPLNAVGKSIKRLNWSGKVWVLAVQQGFGHELGVPTILGIDRRDKVTIHLQYLQVAVWQKSMNWTSVKEVRP